MKAAPIALADDRTCVAINRKAIRAATISREARERLRYPMKVNGV